MSRKRIRDIRHQELIDATVMAIHKRGYAAVTMVEIAREADASAASINYYFGSKEKLMEATMRHLLATLKQAMLRRYETAQTPADRLFAVLDANFDDALFTVERCNFWMQFWANAPYVPALERLHRINRARVLSHFRSELRELVPDHRREVVREALQSYMDGIWLETAQSRAPVDPAHTRAEARRVARLLIDSPA